MQRIWGMNSSRTFSFLFIFLVLISQVVLAEEQSIDLNIKVSDSYIARAFHWLYSESTKQLIIGSMITVLTILAGAGLYYLVELFY